MYQVILFDVDGVLLSEKRCFDSTTLSIWEMLYSDQALGLQGESFTSTPQEEEIEQIRAQVLDHDRILTWLKSQGMNSNWDMVSLLFGYQLQRLLYLLHQENPSFVEDLLTRPLNRRSLMSIGDAVRRAEIKFQPDFPGVIQALHTQKGKLDLLANLDRLAWEWSGIETKAFSHGNSLWKLGRDIYQEWYLGAKQFENVEKKKAFYPDKLGFLDQEIPLAEPSAIKEMLSGLHQYGIALGIGTGRPDVETKVPLTALNLYSHFDQNRIVTASDVQRAEEVYPAYSPLGKPRPFTYVKGYLGRHVSDAKCVVARLPVADGEKILIVGDSIADLLAAQEMGCDFAATLTGPSGSEARGKFEELQADYILDNVTDLLDVIHSIHHAQQESKPENIDAQEEQDGGKKNPQEVNVKETNEL
ncbi:HAD family hydrolase [Marininema halotolerans]|uniref:Phosphoglycolate phosphatase, HAD superfamily n=1 Tax=Marininema halotolerans TaxID=1155944 RepID=A0A1I6Q1C0_9BACL|nr:HAD family hydrolase [Marininema halotolerans]SFS46223.1 Phosphoglycolate phosphatase, HAD superfamily [Marininema halotolerans]